MQFGFPNGVTATLSANAAAGATTVSVNALSGAIASGTSSTITLQTVTANGGAVTITQVVLTASAASGATSLSVRALSNQLNSGVALNFNGTTVILSATVAKGATTLSINSLSAALANGSTNQIPKNALTLLVNPLGESLGVGSVLTFGLTTVTVTTAAPQGATAVVVGAVGTAIPGGTTSEPVEIVTTSAAVAANATKMSVQPLNRALPLTTLVGGNLVFSPLTFGTTNVLLEDDIALSTVATGATTMKVTSPEGNKFFGGGGGLGMPAGAQLKFGNTIVTLSKAAGTGSTTIHVQPTTAKILAGATNSANPGDTTLYVTPLPQSEITFLAGYGIHLPDPLSMQSPIAANTKTDAAAPGHLVYRQRHRPDPPCGRLHCYPGQP